MLNYCQPIYLALGCKEQMSTCGRCFQWALAGEYKCGHRPAVPVLSCLLLPSFLFLGHPPTGMPTWRAAQGWATVTAWWGGGGVELGALSCPPPHFWKVHSQLLSSAPSPTRHFLPDLTSYFPLQALGVTGTPRAEIAGPGETRSQGQVGTEWSWEWGWELELG